MLFKKNNNMEHFYDILPYKYHWNIFECLTMDCIRKESYLCYKACDDIPVLHYDSYEKNGTSPKLKKDSEPSIDISGTIGEKERCRKRCMDYADMQADNIKYNDYQWSISLPRFKYYSLLKDSTC